MTSNSCPRISSFPACAFSRRRSRLSLIERDGLISNIETPRLEFDDSLGFWREIDCYFSILYHGSRALHTEKEGISEMKQEIPL